MRRTLAIEASCDDTSIALVEEHDGYFSVVNMLTHTQTIHKEY
jgi:tRNA A37 threonylcarbamoyltransferase TsaD